MSVRDIHEWAASPAIEYVTATRMNAIAESFGRNRLVAMSRPDVDLISWTTHYVCLDYVQSPHLRVCFQASAIPSPSATPEVIFNVYNRSALGGPSTNNSTYYGPSNLGGVGWPVMRLPLCDRFRDPWTWVESGRDDDQYDTAGYRIPIEFGALNLYWAQLSLLQFPSALGFDGFRPTRFTAFPQHQNLLLELSFNEPTTGDLGQVKNLMVWEWPRHPETPTFYLDYRSPGPGPLFAVAYDQDKSDYSVGRGSKYDIYRGT